MKAGISSVEEGSKILQIQEMPVSDSRKRACDIEEVRPFDL